MTSTIFTMRVMTSETTMSEVTITGAGLKYDADTGAILSGEIFGVSLSSNYVYNKKITLLNVQQLSGINTSAEKLAEAFGDHFWNQAKLVVEVFDKFAHMNHGISVSYFSAAKNYTIATDHADYVAGFKYNEVIEGNAGDDDLFGGNGNDSIYGGKGDDYISGDNGNDLLIDMDGNNMFYGGAGHDQMRGGIGVDVLYGGAGNDLIYGAGGIDTASGGAGADQFVFSAKEAGRLMITDFDKSDVLINLLSGSADEAYKDFMEHAHQDGRHVVYDSGELHLVLRNFKLELLDVHHFADASIVEKAGLL